MSYGGLPVTVVRENWIDEAVDKTPQLDQSLSVMSRSFYKAVVGTCWYDWCRLEENSLQCGPSQ